MKVDIAKARRIVDIADRVNKFSDAKKLLSVAHSVTMKASYTRLGLDINDVIYFGKEDIKTLHNLFASAVLTLKKQLREEGRTGSTQNK